MDTVIYYEKDSNNYVNVQVKNTFNTFKPNMDIFQAKVIHVPKLEFQYKELDNENTVDIIISILCTVMEEDLSFRNSLQGTTIHFFDKKKKETVINISDDSKENLMQYDIEIPLIVLP